MLFELPQLKFWMHTDLAQRGQAAKTALTDLMLVRSRTHPTSATEAPHLASYDTIMLMSPVFFVRALAQPWQEWSKDC
jgi:hypothetical protein